MLRTFLLNEVPHLGSPVVLDWTMVCHESGVWYFVKMIVNDTTHSCQ